MERAAVEAFYRRYIDRCNAHAFGGLGEFVADDVRVNDAPVGLDALYRLADGRIAEMWGDLPEVGQLTG